MCFITDAIYTSMLLKQKTNSLFSIVTRRQAYGMKRNSDTIIKNDKVTHDKTASTIP